LPRALNVSAQEYMLPFLKNLKLIYSLPITYFIITDHAVFEYLLNKLKQI